MAQNNLMAALAYLFGWVSGLIVYFISKDDKFARFHGLQSILFSIAEFVLIVAFGIAGFILSFVLMMVSPELGAISMILVFGVPALVGLVLLLVWLWCMYQAYSGNMYKLPVIGNFAERHS
jgi:uncharacterized membrane protein